MRHNCSHMLSVWSYIWGLLFLLSLLLLQDLANLSMLSDRYYWIQFLAHPLERSLRVSSTQPLACPLRILEGSRGRCRVSYRWLGTQSHRTRRRCQRKFRWFFEFGPRLDLFLAFAPVEDGIAGLHLLPSHRTLVPYRHRNPCFAELQESTGITLE